MVKSAISASGHYSKKVGTAKDDDEYVPYIGYSISFARQIFLLDKDYKKSKDYLKSLFIPSIILGFSLEYQQAMDNKEYAEDGITKKMVFTPYLDFKVKPSSQFRIGVPIQKYSGQNEEIMFGPFIQYSIQIAKM